MNVTGKGARNFEFALDERPVNNEFRVLIGDLTGKPGLDSLTQWLEKASLAHQRYATANYHATGTNQHNRRADCVGEAIQRSSLRSKRLSLSVNR